MKTQDTKRLFSALANKLRLNILEALRRGEMSVSDIVAAVSAQQSAVSHNLRPLIGVGLVAVRGEGPFRFYSLRTENVLPLFEHLDEWKEMVDSAAAVAARESRRGFDLLFRLAPVGIFIGTRGRITFANPMTAKIFGMANSQEAVGKFAYDFIPKSSIPQMDAILGRLHRGLAVHGAYVRMKRTDGREVEIEVDAAPFQRKEKTSIVILRDITERRELERRVGESEARYRRVFEESPLGVVIQDSQGRYLRANRRFCQLVGYSEKELRKKTFFELTHRDHWKDDRKAINELVSGKIDKYQVEKRYLTKSGQAVWVRANVAPFRESDGKTRYFQILVEDISKEKGGRDELIEAEERCRQLVRRGPDSVCTVNDDGTILSVQCRRSDWGSRVVIGRKIMSLLPQEMRSGLLRAIKKASRTGRPQVVETKYGPALRRRSYVCHVAKVNRSGSAAEISVCIIVVEP